MKYEKVNGEEDGEMDSMAEEDVNVKMEGPDDFEPQNESETGSEYADE